MRDSAPSDPLSQLFRPEVLATQGYSATGGIRMTQSLSTWSIVAASVMVLAALLGYVLLGSVTNKARVSGLVVPASGSVNISSPNAGIIVRSLVAEGQSVKAGQALFELSTARHLDVGEMTTLVDRQLANRKRALEEDLRLLSTTYSEKVASLQAKLDNQKSELVQAEQEATLIQQRIGLSKQSLEQYQSLQRSGYFSYQQVRQKQEELIDVEARLSALKRSKLQLEANVISIKSELTQSKTSLTSEKNSKQISLALVEQELVENRSRRSSFVTSPHDGMIAGVNFPAGQAISAGQAVATLIPISRAQNYLEVHLYAPSRSAGFLQNGQNVLLRVDAYPYQKFGLQRGTISDISAIPFSPNELQAMISNSLMNSSVQTTGYSANEPLYRIKVKLESQTIMAYGKPQPLRPGMTLQADINRDSRRIWEWLAEPLLAATSR